ncbi:MAG: histidine kinase, partial [Bacteroidota bacterium]
LIILLLGTALNVGTYYLNQWQFNYPGFSIFFNKNNPNSQMDLFWGYVITIFLLVIYGLYACAREVIIHFIERPGSRRSLRILICNQVTTFLTNYLLFPVFILTFHLVHEHDAGIGNFLFVISVFLVFMSNTYWLFPLKGEGSFFRRQIIVRLLLSTFIYTVPFIAPFDLPGRLLFILLILWGIQLFITTPITWVVYQIRKDKILALIGAQKALAKSNTDLQFLRSQINPHFLFNVMNTLYGTALQENAQLTAEGIQKLGDMMRFMLHENNLDFIPMEKEINYLKNYISLQKLRTQSSPEIIIEDNIREQNCNHQIAPMLFIPLVENAFKHGISLKEKSWIKINLECNAGNIIFEVRNSMHPKNENDPEKDRSGIGFRNVVHRLKLIYPGKHQITVNGDGKEFLVQLAIQP